MDPLAEKYRGIGSYVYVANNPINFIDPDGRDIKIYYNQRRNAKGELVANHWTFNGKNANTAPDNQFVKDFLAAYNYNTRNGGGDNIKRAAFDSYRYELFEIEPMISASASNLNGRNIVKWNPLTGLQTADDDILSPATILEHEFDHAIARQHDLEGFYKRANKGMKDYTDAEEYRVITGSETKTAKANGEISSNKAQSRYSHSSGFHVPVQSPTSTKIRNTKERNKSNITEIVKGLYHYGK